MLETVCVDSGRPGPHLLLTGGVHGDEYDPMAALRELSCMLPSQLLRGRVSLVPVVNQPAFECGQRTGPDGLDLARTCPGRAAGSITEQIAFELSRLIATADYYMDLHTGGTRLCVLPLAGYMLHPNREVLEVQRRMARACGLPLVWGTDPALEGRSLSVARDRGISAIYTEYQGGGPATERGIAACVRACCGVMRELGLIDGTPGGPAPLVVEDPRPGSGHMQVCHPSEMAGFFDPAVSLGGAVNAGDCLGTVVSPTGNATHEIRAHHGGLVIVLHTRSRIDAGASAAVILETTGRLPEMPL